jgi:hypothetical protein
MKSKERGGVVVISGGWGGGVDGCVWFDVLFCFCGGWVRGEKRRGDEMVDSC